MTKNFIDKSIRHEEKNDAPGENGGDVTRFSMA